MESENTESEIKPKNLYQKLLEIQKSVNGLAKDKKSNNYSYVTGDKILGFVKPLMNDLGLLLKQEVTSIENERMDYKTGIGTQYEKPKSEILSKVMMKFTWIDTETGEKDENSFGANGQNEWEKGLGSALTYAERYFLLKFFHIATDEDDIDNDKRKPEASKQTEQSKTPPPPVQTKEQTLKIAIYEVECVGNKEDLTKLWNTYKALRTEESFASAVKKRTEELTPKK